LLKSFLSASTASTRKYVMITAALRRLETRFDHLEADRLRERITALELRVSALESPES
jgi:hypothetical protein